MSSRPSPSRSPVVTLFHQPIRELRGEREEGRTEMGASQAENVPPSLRKMRRGPHSPARINSGSPSPFKSLNTAPLTSPTFCSSLLFAASRSEEHTSELQSHSFISY